MNSSCSSGRRAAASRPCCGLSRASSRSPAGELCDRRQARQRRPRRADRDIAMVFQDYALYPHMRVYDNMALLRSKLRGMPQGGDRRAGSGRAARMLAHRGLSRSQAEGAVRRPAPARRHGPRHRAQSRRCFCSTSRSSNLDAKLRAQVRAEIKSLSQQLKTTMVFVTHDQIEAMTMADRIVVLQNGIGAAIRHARSRCTNGPPTSSSLVSSVRPR